MHFQCNVWIRISLKFVPDGPIKNNPALVQIMAWRRTLDKPLFEPNVVQYIDTYMHRSTSMCWTDHCQTQSMSMMIWGELYLYTFIKQCAKMTSRSHCAVIVTSWRYLISGGGETDKQESRKQRDHGNKITFWLDKGFRLRCDYALGESSVTARQITPSLGNSLRIRTFGTLYTPHGRIFFVIGPITKISFRVMCIMCQMFVSLRTLIYTTNNVVILFFLWK